ncbi:MULTISPECIES: DedA family protein [Staphylococcus]|uniref:DedA family protein n=1 Tax=Staphylococcus hsinchuensis TaxID=3051183 RepID=A0ABZ3EEM6_9STAP|nr:MULTISPECIES: DedA family protein [unclassified Staphylococcus]
MEHILTQFINTWGYAAIAILILLENILPFIPSEIILTLSGLMSVKSDLDIAMLFIISTIASLIGLITLYYISRLVSEEKLYRFVDKYGKWIKLRGRDVERANDWFDKYSAVAVFVCRFIPVLRVLITIPAGINRMNVVAFTIISLIGTTIWNFGLILLGRALSDNWDLLMNSLHTYSYIMYVIIAIVVIYLIVKFYKNKNKKRVR